MNIRARVVLGTVVPMLVVMLGGGVALLLVVQDDERESRRNAVQAATTADAANVGARLSRVAITAEGLAAQLRAAEIPDDDLYALAEELLLATPLAQSVGVAFAPNGSTPPFAPHVARVSPDLVRFDLAQEYEYATDVAGQQWYREPIATGLPTWTEAYLELAAAGGSIVTRSVPFVTPSGRRGVATASVALDDLRTMIESTVTVGRGWALLTTDGATVLADAVNTSAQDVLDGQDSPRARVLRTATGSDLANASVDLFWERLESTRLILVVAVQERTVLGSFFEERLGLAGVIILAALVVGGTGYLIAGWISRPIQRLTVLAGEMAAGDLDRSEALTVGGGSEVAELASALGAMAGQLQERIDDLVRVEQRRFAQLMGSTPDAVLIVDGEGTIVEANDNAATLTGFPLDRLVGRPATLVLDRAAAAEAQSPATSEDGPRPLECVLTTRDGADVPVEVAITPIETEEGRQLVLNVRDISERLEAHDRLRDSEEYHRTVFEVAEVGVMETDIGDGARIVRANEAMGRLLGYRSEELVGRTPDEFTHPDDRELTFDVVRDVGDGKQRRFAVDKRYLHRDGHAVWVRVNGAVLVDDDGTHRRGIVAVTDMSARRRSEALIRGVFDNSPDAYLLAVDGVVSDVNEAACELLARQPDDLLGKAPRELFPAEVSAERDSPWGTFAEYWRSAIDRSTPVSFDLTLDTPERSVPVGVVIAPIATDDSREVVLAIARDMTDSVRFREQLVATRDAAQAADRAKSEFLATMSHEIRTPMNGVVGMLELLGASPLGREERQMAASSLRSAKNLLAILNDVLDFSKIEAGQLDIESVPVSLADLIDDVGEVFGVKAHERGNALLLTADHDVPDFVEGDPVRLRQVLHNLVGNAVKFTRDGDVRVHASADGDGVRLVVVDEGIGMTSDQVDRLFTPFRQAEQSTSRRYGGTGLGLTIVKRLVELMGGHIEVTSTPEVGSRFEVRLPLRACPPPDDARSSIDLRGVTVLSLTGRVELDDVVSNHLGAAGSDVQRCDSVDELLSRCQEHGAPGVVDVVFLGRQIGDDDRARVVSTLAADPATERIAAVATRRDGLDWADPSGVYVMDGAPLRRRVLQRAVGVVTGRASPEPVNPLGLRSGAYDHLEAPTVEEAEANGELVLIVDDHPVNRDVLTRQVRLLGYASEVAVDGEQALAMLEQRRYGLILSDIHMPRVDGYELCRRIRESEPDDEHQPIVAITANAMRGEDDRALANGMDGYLTKPTDLRSLRETLHRWIEPSPRSTADAPQQDDQAGGADDVAPPSSADGPGVVFDRAVLMDMFLGDDAAVADLLRDYLDAMRQGVAAYLEAVAADDDGLLEAQAHKLASSAAMVGAVELAHLARKAENLMRGGETGAGRDMGPAIRSAAERAAKAIRDAVNDGASGPRDDAVPAGSLRQGSETTGTSAQ